VSVVCCQVEVCCECCALSGRDLLCVVRCQVEVCCVLSGRGLWGVLCVVM
jgi:hypothetical protein